VLPRQLRLRGLGWTWGETSPPCSGVGRRSCGIPVLGGCREPARSSPEPPSLSPGWPRAEQGLGQRPPQVVPCFHEPAPWPEVLAMPAWFTGVPRSPPGHRARPWQRAALRRLGPVGMGGCRSGCHGGDALPLGTGRPAAATAPTAPGSPAARRAAVRFSGTGVRSTDVFSFLVYSGMCLCDLPQNNFTEKLITVTLSAETVLTTPRLTENSGVHLV